jgi:hypothetical protein
MPDADNLPAHDRAMHYGRTVARLRRELAVATIHRDQAIRELAEESPRLTIRQIAGLAEVTHGRVQQIISGALPPAEAAARLKRAATDG